MNRRLAAAGLTRRDFLYGLGSTLGSVAFTGLLAQEEARAGKLAAKEPHHPAKAKACIFLFMEGGPSHLDTFDPKPKLHELHGKAFTREDKFASAMASGNRYYVESPFKFRKAGSLGIEINEHYAHLADCVDDMCFYRGCVGESINHPTACYHMNTGNRFGGDPAIGGWVTYGLGTENENLPSFVVLPEVSYPQGGAANWSNGFLPADYQATPLRAQGSPILDLQPPEGVTRAEQRANLDLLARLNNRHEQTRASHADELAARMATYELAFRMQAEVPDIIDIAKESEATQELYGLDQDATKDFGRRCLLARRLVEQGVRFIQIYSSGWDSHDYIAKAHAKRIEAVDKPIAGLLKDLKQRGLLDDTLVICSGEFGRSPDNGIRGGSVAYGRDHNAKAMSIWMAGGGVPRGAIVGATDEIGDRAVECVHPIKDLHCTILHLLGLDDNKLTFFHAGRFKQLSQVGGSVISELVA
ncbi:hypothetical protein Pan216_11430 [Planctomycetes bacterium Pan216]|uniref:Sulfatase n=1 Tax=Kolteria novifilia TaxID=2527975 RepID=A0A518B026_9BACT|nr:hypothetical protein Pan216_11430 [Planctomycetes bacterium Pan216]